MIRARSMEPWWYIPMAERGEGVDKPARFRVKVLSSSQRARMNDEITSLSPPRDPEDESTMEVHINVGTKELIQIQYGLVGWDNIMDEDGKERQFKAAGFDGKCSPENINALSDTLCSELATAIEDGNNVSGGDEKK
ncbi:MAG: hypothetical protein U9Q07_05585 [Planctomycetota bacterium]|nr:hypothetical protein [Planctomycetota bacterium]